MELQLAKASRLKSINTARSTENVPLLPRATGSGVVRSLSTMKLEQTGITLVLLLDSNYSPYSM